MYHLNMYDNDTIKWTYEGKRYCVHIRQDEYADSPREWDNLALMACFHSRYNLGDPISEKSPEEFWQHLVRQHVSNTEVFDAARDGRLDGIRLAENCEEPGTYDVYETCYLAGFQTRKEASEHLEYSEKSPQEVAEYLEDDLTVEHCQKLLEPYLEWLPLWLYDHSGITISCGARRGQYADRWDSGCVGWIVTSKSKIMEETRDVVKDDNGNPIRVEIKHRDGSVTYSCKIIPVSEERWRSKAIDIMEGEVEQYDEYLCGEVYRYDLYEEGEGGEWEEVDGVHCGGFYGSNIVESGLADEVGFGLADAIQKGEIECGEAEKHTRTYYSF